MAEEFGSSKYQNDSGYSNTGKEKDNRSQQANTSPREFHDYSKQNESAQKKSGKRSLLRTLTTAAAATVAAATVLPTVLTPSVDVHFDYLNATNTVLEYVLSFENMEEGDDVVVLVVTPNGNTVSEQPVEAEIVSGTVDGLMEGARYDVVVKSGNRTVTSRSVTMERIFITETDVWSQCKCAEDGMFHFRLENFRDENGYWSQFKATLTDAFGNRSECDFGSSPEEEHTLDVEKAGMRGNRAILRITCVTTEPDEEGDRTARERVLFEGEVNI